MCTPSSSAEPSRRRHPQPDIRDHLLDLFFLRLEAECAHRDLQLLGVNVAAAIRVEEVKGLLDLLLLLLSQLLLLLSASIEATERHDAARRGCCEAGAVGSRAM